jgi:uncharacterized protein YndB with AHSA1/START domain
MASRVIRLTEVLPASPKRVYAAWMSSRAHTAHDGYIRGWNLVIVPGKRIVQSWRTTEFAPETPDSVVEVRLAPARGGTTIAIVHRDRPARAARVRQAVQPALHDRGDLDRTFGLALIRSGYV